MNKADEKALKVYPKMSRISEPHGVIPADNKSHYLGDANAEKREGFVVGYHQAEKDLSDKAKVSSGWDGFYYGQGYKQAEKDLIENIHEKSWRLDEQLWSGFKDIEEASYQYIYDASNDWLYEIPTWHDVQDAFKAGAEWKENIELTWEDLAIIEQLSDNFVKHNQTPMSDEEFYKEIVKRFKERKEK